MPMGMPLQEPLGFWRPFVRVRPAQKFIKLLLEVAEVAWPTTGGSLPLNSEPVATALRSKVRSGVLVFVVGVLLKMIFLSTPIFPATAAALVGLKSLARTTTAVIFEKCILDTKSLEQFTTSCKSIAERNV